MSIKSTRLPGIVEIKDPGASGTFLLPEHHHVVCSVSTAAGETRTLGTPKFFGQQVTLAFNADVGDATITAALTVNQTGDNTMIMADAGDEITLRASRKTNAYVWRVVSNDGVALSTV